MIADAIYSTINPIVPAYPLIGDVDAKMPLAVYGVRYEAVRSKDRIELYNGTVFVSVITPRHSTTETKSNLVKAAMEALTGQTVNDTIFLSVQWTGIFNISFDPDDRAYYSEMEFSIKTKNQ